MVRWRWCYLSSSGPEEIRSYYRLFVATSLEKVMTNAGRAKGFRSVHQEKVLRHFTAELEPYE